MKKLLIALMTLSSVSAFAQNQPNQSCKGTNQYDEVVETNLFVGKKIDKKESEAKLVISLNGALEEVTGKITNKPDLIGTRMFINTEDSLRYLTSGLLYDANSYNLRLNMICSKFKL